jgi:hypothetical protein
MSSFDNFDKMYGVSRLWFKGKTICKIKFINDDILDVYIPNHINTRENLYEHIENDIRKYFRKIRKQKLDEIAN